MVGVRVIQNPPHALQLGGVIGFVAIENAFEVTGFINTEGCGARMGEAA
jgi:hypothetical protein